MKQLSNKALSMYPNLGLLISTLSSLFLAIGKLIISVLSHNFLLLIYGIYGLCTFLVKQYLFFSTITLTKRTNLPNHWRKFEIYQLMSWGGIAYTFYMIGYIFLKKTQAYSLFTGLSVVLLCFIELVWGTYNFYALKSKKENALQKTKRYVVLSFLLPSITTLQSVIHGTIHSKNTNVYDGLLGVLAGVSIIYISTLIKKISQF